MPSADAPPTVPKMRSQSSQLLSEKNTAHANLRCEQDSLDYGRRAHPGPSLCRRGSSCRLIVNAVAHPAFARRTRGRVFELTARARRERFPWIACPYRAPRIPGDLEDHQRDQETDHGIGDVDAESDHCRARDDTERDVPVDTRVVPVGDQRRAGEPPPRA